MKKILLLLLTLPLLPIITFAAEQVDLNTATLAQLDTLVGIGPTLAQRIIDARPYASVDDLLKVKDIGEKTLQKIKEQRLAYVAVPTQTETPAPTIPQPVPQPAPKIINPGGIFINQLLPSPEGADETDEWIEIKNTNTFNVSLGGWKLKDAMGTVTTYIFPAKTTIKASEVLVVKRPVTKITLNNEADAVTLLLPNGTKVDSVSYENAAKGQTYGPAAAEAMAGKPGAPPTTLSKTEKPDNKGTVGTAPSPFLADAAESGANPWIIFLAAVALLIVFAGITAIWKFKILKLFRN